MKCALKILSLFSLFLSMQVVAQEPEPQQLIESIIESHLDKIDEQSDVALIIEDLEGFLENPINLNATSADELSRLYLLNDVQIKKIMDYLEIYGPAYSIYELNTIDGLGPELLQKLGPFIWFGPTGQSIKFSDSFKYGKNQLLLRALGTVQKARGYLPGKDGEIPYEGNRFRYYTRYRHEANDRFSAGITAEKDPGESFFKASNQQGFDFYSAHVSLKINSTLENITAGDFLVRSGQGLVAWQGYTSGKSEDVLGISKTNQGIRPSTAVDENLFFRGAATTLRFGQTKWSFFYSQKRDDGNIVESDTAGTFITSLQTSGYHRTVHEIADKNAVTNTNYGVTFSWIFRNLKLGAVIIQQQLEMPLNPAAQMYNRYRFRGKDNTNAGIDYSFNRGRMFLFGEAAISKSGGKAAVQGAVIHLNDQLGFSALFRHFDKNYHALWANTFAEGSNISNESGLYFGTRLLPFKFVTLSAYSDIYRMQWINYTTAAPSAGWDILAQASVTLSPKAGFYLRLKNEEKEEKFIEKERYVNLPVKNQKLRFHFNYNLNEKVSLKTRIENVQYRGTERENGWLAFQDVRFSPVKIPLTLIARVAWFDTDSYNSRIYAYENDLLYTFSIPAFFGSGFRTILNLNYKISDKIDFWLKVGNTSWNDRKIISSGYNEIQGNNKTELKFQLRLKI